MNKHTNALKFELGWWPQGGLSVKRSQAAHSYLRHNICLKYVVPWVLKHSNNQKKLNILDFGCGTGSTAAAFAPFTSNHIEAFDIDEKSVNAAKNTTRNLVKKENSFYL